MYSSTYDQHARSVYACHPELGDLVDLKVCVLAGMQVREARLLSREGQIGPWERQWHEAENWYFRTLMPDTAYDILIESGTG